MNRPEHFTYKSYTPYSAREDSCFITGTSGLLYPGVRIENSSFPLTITAVQAALCSCLGNRDKPYSLHYPEGKKTNNFDWWKQDFDIKLKGELPENYTVYDPLLDSVPSIPEKLEELCDNAVVKNSCFPVSAILETDQGLIPGVNVEFSVWQMGLCAERVAILRAVSAGILSFKRIYIYAPKSDFCSPCGACRQILHEFMPTKQAVLYHSKTESSTHYIEHLLPHAFIAGSLDKNKL